MPDPKTTPRPFELEEGGRRLAGEELGEGPPVVLAHGVTATRRYVVHGSKALARAGYRQISYDARAHGESGPAPEGSGYSYAELAGDLGRVIGERAGDRPVVCGDSMGCHTAAAHALEHAEELAGVVLIRPVTLGLPAPDEALAHWDRLADGLERGGVEGFMARLRGRPAVSAEFEQTVLRFTRERMGLHRDPVALARAIREVPRSVPFEGMVELESLRRAGAGRRQPRRGRPGPSLRGRRGLGAGDPRGGADQRGAGSVAARVAGGPALARDRGLLRAPRGRGAPGRLDD